MNIEQRLVKLERQNRWMRRGLMAIVLIGAVGMFCGMQAQPRAYRAQEFIMVDAAGKAQGVLSMAGGGPGLRLGGIEGNDEGRSITIGITQNVAMVDIAGDKGRSVTLRDDAGGSGIIVRDGTRIRGFMGLLSADDSAIAQLSDKNGQRTWDAP